jgi:hypothetical protein
VAGEEDLSHSYILWISKPVLIRRLRKQ